MTDFTKMLIAIVSILSIITLAFVHMVSSSYKNKNIQEQEKTFSLSQTGNIQVSEGVNKENKIDNDIISNTINNNIDYYKNELELSKEKEYEKQKILFEIKELKKYKKEFEDLGRNDIVLKIDEDIKNLEIKINQ